MSKFNTEGYYDPTAYKAIKNIEKERNEMEVYRGDIFYVKKAGYTTWSEQEAGRPAVIVSNNTGNKFSNNVEVVYLTSQNKTELPTHVDIICKVPSTAMCESVYTVSKERLTDYVRSCTDKEMEQIDAALLISLALYPDPVTAEQQNENVQDIQETVQQNDIDTAKIEAERDVYKMLYNQLLEKMIA